VSYISRSPVRALTLIAKIAKRPLGDDEMFRDRLVHWVRVLDVLMSTMSSILVRGKVNISIRRHGKSNTRERDFERELAARKAYLSSFFAFSIDEK